MELSRYRKIFGVGPFGALVSFLLLLPVWRLDQILGHPVISQSPTLLKICGGALIVTGLGIHFLTIWTLRHWWVEKQVCTSGPYKYFRHPMYAAWITFIVPGISLWFNSWVFLAWPVILHPVWHRIIAKEETILIGIFGDAYRDYAGRTGRFIPRF